MSDSLKNRLKSDMDFVTTRDPPVKSDTGFVILVVEIVILFFISHDGLKGLNVLVSAFTKIP